MQRTNLSHLMLVPGLASGLMALLISLPSMCVMSDRGFCSGWVQANAISQSMFNQHQHSLSLNLNGDSIATLRLRWQNLCARNKHSTPISSYAFGGGLLL
jgi:hypothetical protein